MENRELKLKLLDIAGGDVEKAKEMLGFVIEDRPVKVIVDPSNGLSAEDRYGVFLVDNNGNEVLYSGERIESEWVGISLHTPEGNFRVCGFDSKQMEESVKDIPKEAKCYSDPCSAMSAVNGIMTLANVADIIIARNDLHSSKEYTCFVPSIRELMWMFMYLDNLNKALKGLGYSGLNGIYYSSTKCTGNTLWVLDFSNGCMRGVFPDCNVLNIRLCYKYE